MIKRIIHIDQNFPRRLNEQDSLKTISDTNWGFNTKGQTLNGEIVTESPQKKTIDNVNDSINVDQTFEDGKVSTVQLDNLEQDKQIRFNANVFNYIVHTELSNVILKYDSPVVYAEGKEDGEFDIDNIDLVADITHYCIKGLEVPFIYGRLGHGLTEESSKPLVAKVVYGALGKSGLRP